MIIKANNGKATINGFPNNGVVELGSLQRIQKGQTFIGDAGWRKGRVALTPEKAREVADSLNKMADKMENENDNQ